MPDDLAAFLERAHDEMRGARGLAAGWYGARLFAAIDGVLKLADEWIASEYPDDVPIATSKAAAVAAEVEASVHCGLSLREAISSALLGSQTAPGESR
jgi:hypothetical protein